MPFLSFATTSILSLTTCIAYPTKLLYREELCQVRAPTALLYFCLLALNLHNASHGSLVLYRLRLGVSRPHDGGNLAPFVRDQAVGNTVSRSSQ